jgi:hypothetical protein
LVGVISFSGFSVSPCCSSSSCCFSFPLSISFSISDEGARFLRRLETRPIFSRSTFVSNFFFRPRVFFGCSTSSRSKPDALLVLKILRYSSILS